MAEIIDGLRAAQRWQDETAMAIQNTPWTQRPHLSVILVGESAPSKAYVKRKSKVAQQVGVVAELIELPATVTEADLLDQIDQLNKDTKVHGILVQLPLPAHILEHQVIQAIAPEKDVDGFHPVNVGRLHEGGPARLLAPCTPLGCMRLIRQALNTDDLSSLTAAVIGRSNIVGKPMSAMLLQANCTVLQVHSKTKDPESLVRQADIVVAAIGRPKFVGPDWFKPGAIVIDVGINRIPSETGKSRLVGDIDYDHVLPLVGAITPVPGGVGPMTVAGLMHNTLVAARYQQGLAV